MAAGRAADQRDGRCWTSATGGRTSGELGKLHVRFGKGSRGRGPRPGWCPAINAVDALLDWWLTDVRHQFGDDWADPDAPLLPSERRDRLTGRHACGPAPTRCAPGWPGRSRSWLPAWAGRLTPHGLRHFCASSLYGRGVDLKAIQELLGHEWLSTTTRYIHVHDEHIEQRVGTGERAGGCPAATERRVRRCDGTCG